MCRETCRRCSWPANTSILWYRWMRGAGSGRGWRAVGRSPPTGPPTPSTCARTCASATARRSPPKRSRPTWTTSPIRIPSPAPPAATSASTAAPRSSIRIPQSCISTVRTRHFWKSWRRGFSACSRRPRWPVRASRTVSSRSAPGRSRWSAGTARTSWCWCAIRSMPGRRRPPATTARPIWIGWCGNSSPNRRYASPRCRLARSMSSTPCRPKRTRRRASIPSSRYWSPIGPATPPTARST